MKSLGILFLGLVVLAVSGFLVYAGMYGALNSGDQAVQRALGNIETDLQRRSDLLPNLVKTVQAYAKHESKVFTEIADARSRIGSINIKEAAVDPEKMKQLMGAQNELSGALSRLLVIVEKYPDLKANEGYITLQGQIEGTENRINVARQRYNEAVERQNTNVNGLIGKYVASANDFKKYEYFKADAGAQKVPELTFE